MQRIGPDIQIKMCLQPPSSRAVSGGSGWHMGVEKLLNEQRSGYLLWMICMILHVQDRGRMGSRSWKDARPPDTARLS